MKRLILLLLALYSINCTVNDCAGEKNLTNCNSHDVKEIGDYNCHPVHSVTEAQTEDSCEPFPNSADEQKNYFGKYKEDWEKKLMLV